MRELPQLNEKNKERPLCFPYSVKARALIHAHLSRLDLPPDTLRTGKKRFHIFSMTMKFHSGDIGPLPPLSMSSLCEIKLLRSHIGT